MREDLPLHVSSTSGLRLVLQKLPPQSHHSHKIHDPRFLSHFWNWFLDKATEPLQLSCQELNPCNPILIKLIFQYKVWWALVLSMPQEQREFK
ncbi:hypothetical protein GYH30_010778 [Glycine max]|uniref:Uncharacterized protein n=1 Tax=Glycine max TaxID=3847 RepID=A0A0R0KBW2_SOYBN|nr:hypothetical protein GYH30_010778 [Glycine max]